MTKPTIARHKRNLAKLETELRRLQFSEIYPSAHLIQKCENLKGEIFKEKCWIHRNDPACYPSFNSFMNSLLKK
jgi:hypothetical protein